MPPKITTYCTAATPKTNVILYSHPMAKNICFKAFLKVYSQYKYQENNITVLPPNTSEKLQQFAIFKNVVGEHLHSLSTPFPPPHNLEEK